MQKYQVLYIYILLALIIVFGKIGYSYIAEQSPITPCRSSAFISSGQREKYYTYPEKLVIQPWNGRHHVYGIFMIPNGYENDHSFTLSIPGNQTYCGSIVNYENLRNVGIYPPPGYSLMKGYVNTRVAFWLILQGKGYQLKQPSSWRLGYVEKQ
ncbi:MAG: hypothetical protein HEQ35_15035 [Gloeotrichia echinulata IR180]|nr:hypothetical protein [Gloeotrichia echinulata DEX184]